MRIVDNPAIFYHEEEEQLYYGRSAKREPFVLRPEAKADENATRDDATHGDAA